MDNTAPSRPTASATAATTQSAVILRLLRICLHSGFAVLLLVAVARLVGTGLGGAGWIALVLSFMLAAVYVAGTVLEKRHSTHPSRFDPRPYALWWLGAVCLLWALLIWASADFVWLAFPLFFLQLHVLPLRLAVPAVALSTVLVIVALWFHTSGDGGALQLPMVLGPVFGAAFAVVTGLAYRALYLEAENQRLAAEELRRTRAELARSQHDAGTLAERARLAREIHDTLAQGFSSIVLMGRSAEKSLDEGDTATARDRLRTVQETAAANLAEARNFVRDLQPPALAANAPVNAAAPRAESPAESPAGNSPGSSRGGVTEAPAAEKAAAGNAAVETAAAESAAAEKAAAGNAAVETAAAESAAAEKAAAGNAAADPLVESLRRLCEKTETEAAARGAGLRCRFDLEGTPVKLPNPYSTTLLRAAQASLGNVWVHARAGTAVVTLSFLGSEVAMDIYDDGVGFDPSTVAGPGRRPDGSGYGLKSLQERVTALAGSLNIESAPGEGTVVAIRLPLGDLAAGNQP